MDAEQLFEQVWQTSPFRNPSAALALVDAEWERVDAREPNPYDAETCRLAMLCVYNLEPPVDHARAALWRVRALSRFTRLGWHEGVAAVMMGEAFRALAIRNDDYPDGDTIDKMSAESAVEPLGIIEQLEPFTREAGSSEISVGPSSPTPALVNRWYHEKRGFFLTVAGRYDEALAAYEQAVAAGDGKRGNVKASAGATLVRYLADLDGGGTGEAARRELEALLPRTGDDDLQRDIRHNLAVMAERGRALKPFEIL